MARDRDHLELPEWREPQPRRMHGGGRSPSRPDRESHGQEIVRQAEAVAGDLQRRVRTAPAGINPKLIFTLRLHPQGNLTEDDLRSLGLRMLARMAARSLLCSPTK